MKEKLKSYNFWVKLVSALILIARVVLAKFGYELDSALVLDLATLVAGVFVLLGIINEPTGFEIKYENMNERENKNMKFKEELQEEIQKLEKIYDDFKAGDLSSAEECINKILDTVDEITDSLNKKNIEAEQNACLNEDAGEKICGEEETTEEVAGGSEQSVESILRQPETVVIEEKPELTTEEAEEIENVIDAVSVVEEVSSKTSVEDEDADKFAELMLDDKIINALASKIIAKLGE